MKDFIQALFVFVIFILIVAAASSGDQEPVAKVQSTIVNKVHSAKPVATDLSREAQLHVTQISKGVREQLEEIKRSAGNERLNTATQQASDSSAGMKQSSEELLIKLDELIRSIKEEDEGGAS
ncbi:MAG: hypothetical protein COY36_05615 [Zetaproteobacteria bacterium CG_4_10_14_0_2_um_filter_55_20]|nr:MAG: hypothetical protein AUJ58_09055 [Zetaproteobacteria bacterium CG1_02_55_237]PIS18643.1 MAG: hypothetical protein COT53_09535 [Zetaproteobacteria bacterium CG08_land_8_20_14_0_20_55_17]PIY53378.1 MAG: hypothetical protein COZ01_03880 [Zetaproteobacteria bacterium CG_4_10_14_0_8_um_filter_55_43]PIZ38719.1 MAG: hypothetical protein COY36_05615 [Zetaproteobacteria bacterium CG_4_10_14_0_2_um_filter_55_20]PJB82583.1 MAG: hypothetical protein CO089_01215 [Zetaproteobacteria bacterium CG_4_9_